MTVREAQMRISSQEFTEWMAFARLHPFGEWRADLRAGIVASTIANVNRGKGKAYKPSDFMPDFKRTRKAEQQSDQHIRNEFMKFGKALKAMRGENG